MAHIVLTNRQLLTWHTEVSANKNTWLGGYALRSRAQEFYKEYGGRIDTAIKRISDLRKKYFEFDEQGQAKFEKTEEGNMIEILLPESKREDYEKDLTAIMDDTMNSGLIMVRGGR